ncbi:RecQ family ATP-dependent DNA helicase [Photobacterium carnosum]|uniref:RecQ family ATP-dependent DNA helicase n=1 Tax=Photobacterium carnosum TaxID=2023717 RepID=UPI001E4467F1|nr:RecQ family ATP-dependent DNA helicase [Photobacterium carnosum]MCD9556765.1 RecQ family ATP-dependent DNA helicase [Photobacterium carnosum]
MIYNTARSLELLKLGSGNSTASFREQQEQAIQHIVEGRGKLLVVQKTGWGKSFVYFIATKLMRENNKGPALLVSPLLALMRNQVEAARRMGLKAEAIHSDNRDEHSRIEHEFIKNKIDILLVTPERLGNQNFRNNVLAPIAEHISLLIVDEAHCISDWGHDFRPHYRLLERIIQALPPRMRLLATTATANNRVTEDLQTVLGPELTIFRGDLDRSSLTLQTISLSSQAERLAWLAEQLTSLPGHGIVYTLTIRDANQVAKWLKENGINVEAYSGDTGEQREHLEQALYNNEIKALIGTTALGMGYDKPDLSFVIHYQAPSSVVAYYQQVGRAGRALDSAYGVLLSGQEENNINDYFINNAFPTVDEVSQIISKLEEAHNGLSLNELMAKLNIGKSRLEHTIDLLSLESPPPLIKNGSIYQLTSSVLSNQFWERAERLTNLRREEQARMQEYVRLQTGHMEFLITELNGDPNIASQPSLPMLPTVANQEKIIEAIAFLKRTGLPIEPRKQWPAGGLSNYNVRGNIRKELQANEGMSLCIWGDAGWGKIVQHGRYVDGTFSNELLSACVELFQKWQPDPAPTWVTCIPSLRHPELVPNFAMRLATALELPFYPALVKLEHCQEQKYMSNSIQQAKNIDGSMGVDLTCIQSGPVLLIDDIVNSRWTSTVAAWLLRSNGSGNVWPIALSQTGN